MLQGCSLFQNNCSFLFEVSSFVIIAWQMFSHMAIGQPRSRRHQHDLNIASQHLHFICKEERDSEIRRGIVIPTNLEYLNQIIFFSVQIILGHYNVCKTVTAFICSKSPWMTTQMTTH